MTTAASDTSTVAFIMKRRYSDSQGADVSMREHPTYYEIMKTGSFDGSDFAYATVTGNPQGISSEFASSQAGAETLKGEQFIVTTRTKYGVCTLDGVSMMKARGNRGSFYDFVTRHMDGTLDEMGANIAFDLQRDGTGLRGRRASISGNVVTLTSKNDVDNFRRGMTIVAAQNSNGSSPRVGSAKVVKLDRAGKKITLDDQSTITSFADNDFIFRKGDIGNCIEGFGACTPLASPTAGVLFRNVERTNDVEALAGSRIDDTTVYPEEAIGNLAVQINIIGKKVSRAIVYPTVFQSMVKRLGAKVIYTSPGGAADVGFESLMIHTAGGPVRVTSDPDADSTVVRVYRPDAHELKSIDEIVHTIKDDGNRSQRQSGNDGIEIRWRSVLNYRQPDQASHGVATFAQ